MNDSALPIGAPSRRKLIAFSIATGSAGDRIPILADFPAHIDNAVSIAALVEAASLDAGMSFADFLIRVAAAAPDDRSAVTSVSIRTGRRPRDWRTDFGISLTKLSEKVALRLILMPGLTKAAARLEVLRRARARARKHRLPEERMKVEAESLKQALR